MRLFPAMVNGMVQGIKKWLPICSSGLIKLTIGMVWMVILLSVHLIPAEEVIEPGDKLQLQITGVVGKLYDVADDGRIDFGLWGKVLVAGLDHDRALEEIKRAIKPYVLLEDKKIFLAIKKKAAVKKEDYVSVFGEVRSPGLYVYKPNLGIMDYIMCAQGTTRFAQIDTIKVIHIEEGKIQAKVFNLEKLLEQGGKQPQIKSGDAIFVPERVRNFTTGWTKVPAEKSVYVIGEVKNPGRYDFIPSLGFLDVLSQAGGPTRDADTKRLAVIRDHKLVVTFDLHAYQRGKQNRLPVIKPKDLIYIPRTYVDYRIKKGSEKVLNVIGEVTKPGRYEIENDMNLLDVLASAGLQSQANISKIRIFHPNEKTTVFNLKKWAKKGDFTRLPVIRGGDTIMIARAKKKESLLKDIKNSLLNLAVLFAASKLIQK